MKSNRKIKIFLIAALCLLIIILLYFYYSSGDKTIESNSQAVSISKAQITKDIDSIINTFGIKKNWHRDILPKSKDTKVGKDSLWISKEILIPNDLPVIELNYEITNYLQSKNLFEKVTEDPKTKNLAIDIFSAKGSVRELIGYLNLAYSDTIKRNAAEICIVLDSIESHPLIEAEDILNSPEEFSVFLPLRNDKADYQSIILDSKSDYLLKFSIGNDDDVTADFKSDMKESVWKSKVKSIALNFSKTAGVILNSKPGLNSFEREIEEEFLKNSLLVFKDTLFSNYNPGAQKVISLFDDIISKSDNGRKFLFYTLNFSRDDFNFYYKQIHILKKLGYKFYSFKDILKRMNKNPERKNY